MFQGGARSVYNVCTVMGVAMTAVGQLVAALFLCDHCRLASSGAQVIHIMVSATPYPVVPGFCMPLFEVCQADEAVWMVFFRNRVCLWWYISGPSRRALSVGFLKCCSARPHVNARRDLKLSHLGLLCC